MRALSSRELTAANAMRTLWREIFSAWLTGACVGLGLAVVTVIFWHDIRLAIVIAAAIMINFTMAGAGRYAYSHGCLETGHGPGRSLADLCHFSDRFLRFFQFLRSGCDNTLVKS
ncbi:MAG: magnesium transporter [Asticcacaulis sp.]